MVLCFRAKRFCSARCQIENHHNFPLLPDFLPICHTYFHAFYRPTLGRFCSWSCSCSFNCHCHGWACSLPLSLFVTVCSTRPPVPIGKIKKRKNNFVGNSFDLFSAQQYKSFVRNEEASWSRTARSELNFLKTKHFWVINEKLLSIRCRYKQGRGFSLYSECTSAN